MFLNLIFAVATVISSGSSGDFFESAVNLPAGISEIRTEQEFTAATIFSLDGSDLPEIFFENSDGKFSPWHTADGESGMSELLFVGRGARSIRVRSEKAVAVGVHFFDTRAKFSTISRKFLATAGTLVARFDPFDDDSFDDPRTGLPAELNLRPPKYISRADWGADENLRLLSTAKRMGRRAGKTWFRTEAERVPPKFRPKLKTRVNSDGERLFWPVSESPKILKFAIHHTGEYIEEERDPMEIMRAIYFFHTITRGWGDIGYNYVIDKQGNIYEGRAGGPRAVGAHTAFHNIGTVGISLMGNFQREQPTDAQLKVLSLLLADHARRFGVDPVGKTRFLGKLTFNITGHRNIAERGHGTACPGRNLVAKLPQIRLDSARFWDILRRNEKRRTKTARDFLRKSSAAPRIFRERRDRTDRTRPVGVGKPIPMTVLQRGDRRVIDISVKNGTDFSWARGTELVVKNPPDGMTISKFRALERVAPGRAGIFRGVVRARTTPNGRYDLELLPVFLNKKIKYHLQVERSSITLPMQVSGDRNFFSKKIASNLVASSFSTPVDRRVISRLARAKPVSKRKPAEDFGIPVKIRLKFFDSKFAEIFGSETVEIFDDRENLLGRISAGEVVQIFSTGEFRKKRVRVKIGSREWTRKSVSTRTNGVLTISNYDRGLGKTKYNEFRERLNFYPGLLVVNELPLEKYLWGLAEEPTTEPTEKKHAIHVLARSYAYAYAGERRKFRTDLYDLEDDPATSQFYLGYGWEKFHSEQKKLVAETRGKMLRYNGKVVVGPYFTQSNGRSSGKWKKQYPWTRAQILPFDRGLEQKGHGVGLSGNSARVLAEKGLDFVEILKYFFEGVEVE